MTDLEISEIDRTKILELFSCGLSVWIVSRHMENTYKMKTSVRDVEDVIRDEIKRLEELAQ